jgi:hypothetical protein
VAALLEADASVDDVDNEGWTPLHFARSADIVESLIMAGADVDHEDRKGKTPGRLALERQDMAVVEAVISGRADPSKIYELRIKTDSSRFVASANQSEQDDNGVQHSHIRGVPGRSARHERDDGGRNTTFEAGYLNSDEHRTVTGRDDSSSFTPSNQTTEHAALQPYFVSSKCEQTPQPDPSRHVSTTAVPEAHSTHPTIGSSPILNIGGSSQQCRLTIGIVSLY